MSLIVVLRSSSLFALQATVFSTLKAHSWSLIEQISGVYFLSQQASGSSRSDPAVLCVLFKRQEAPRSSLLHRLWIIQPHRSALTLLRLPLPHDFTRYFDLIFQEQDLLLSLGIMQSRRRRRHDEEERPGIGVMLLLLVRDGLSVIETLWIMNEWGFIDKSPLKPTTLQHLTLKPPKEKTNTTRGTTEDSITSSG